MNFQIDVSSVSGNVPNSGDDKGTFETEVVSLLQQMLEVQKEAMAYQKAILQAHDAASRWKAFLTRWQEEFPDLAQTCYSALPALERTYSQLMTDLAEQLNEEEPLDNEFALRDFIDRYGPQLAHLGTMLNLLTPLAASGGPDPS